MTHVPVSANFAIGAADVYVAGWVDGRRVTRGEKLSSVGGAEGVRDCSC